MQGRVEVLAHETRDGMVAGAQLDATLQPLHEARRWEVEAAYAFARRRDQDTAWRTAADVIEVALAERRRSAYGPPRWWERVEAGLAVYVVVATLQLASAVLAGHWYRLPSALLYLAIPFLHVQTVRRHSNIVPAVAGASGTIQQRAATLRNAAADATAAASDGAVVEQLCRIAVDAHERGELDRRLGALALATAQRLVAVEIGRHRRRALSLLGTARQRMLTDEAQPDG